MDSRFCAQVETAPQGSACGLRAPGLQTKQALDCCSCAFNMYMMRPPIIPTASTNALKQRPPTMPSNADSDTYQVLQDVRYTAFLLGLHNRPDPHRQRDRGPLLRLATWPHVVPG